MSKLLPNLPIEDLTPANDYLNIIEKGELLKAFFESNKEEFSEIKMFVLYGNWGAGKSTLMKYLEKELRESFNSFFFEAWQFEKDDNLPMSFLEFLLKESESVEEEFYGKILKFGGKLLRGLGKSIKVDVPLYPEGPSIEIDPTPLVDEFSKQELSFYDSLKKFEIEFRRWEDKVTKGKNPDYNLVFVDDLDRCEPENVLNLLSALKLFFTYGKKTIYLCGIDKKAVREAVKTKYGEAVKANEYLEKVFDISFSIPPEMKIFKLIGHYFPNSKIDHPNMNENWDYEISNFFAFIKFYNPRKIKKVLNKYLILKSINEESTSFKMPNFYSKEDDNSSFFETILTLYLLILNEFHNDHFEGIFDLEAKREAYLRAVNNNLVLSGDVRNTEIRNVQTYLFDIEIIQKPLDEIRNLYRRISRQFYACLGPLRVSQVTYDSFENESGFTQLIPEKESIDYLFSKYLIKKEYLVKNCPNLSNCSLREFQKLVTRLL